MMNARTWQTLYRVSAALFFFVALGFISHPSHPILRAAYLTAEVLLIAWAICCAWLGLLLTLGRLDLGCPFCGARSRVIGHIQKDLVLDCPACGEIRIRGRVFGAAVSEKLNAASNDHGTSAAAESGGVNHRLHHFMQSHFPSASPSQEWSTVVRDSKHPILTLLALNICFAIYAYSLRHVFFTAGLAIILPGGFLICLAQALTTRVARSNLGVFPRTERPASYWLHITVLWLAYLLVSLAPILPHYNPLSRP